jgi:hypothetical protein
MNLHAQWIVGFVDGEGCFHLGLNTNKSMSFGFQILPEFVVVQHQRDRQVLEALKSYFKCGYIKVNHGDRLCFLVRNLHDLVTVILPFFEKHKLKTKKGIDFEKFRDVVLMMDKKLHLTEDGFHAIKSLILAMRKWQKSEGLRLLPTPTDAEPCSSSVETQALP